jgi:hypothetical protein
MSPVVVKHLPSMYRPWVKSPVYEGKRGREREKEQKGEEEREEEEQELLWFKESKRFAQGHSIRQS